MGRVGWGVFFLLFLLLPTQADASLISKAPNNLGLVGYWSMNEGVGTKAGDSSGQGNTGTITGSTWVAGKHGKALSFDGANDHVEYNSTNFGDVFTISAWVYPNYKSTIHMLMANGNNGSTADGFHLMINSSGTTDGKIWLDVGNGSSSNDASTAAGVVTINQWNHIVMVVNKTAGTAVTYRNNVNVTSDGTILTDFNTDNIWRFGETLDGQNDFSGKLDDVRIYNRALSASEVAKLYGAGSVKIKSSGGSSFSIVASDDFNRTDGALGSSWTNIINEVKIYSNGIRGNNGGMDRNIAVSSGNFGNDQYSQATLLTKAYPNFPRVGVRYTAGGGDGCGGGGCGKGYEFDMDGNIRAINEYAGYTDLGTASVAPVAGDVMRIEVVGTKITAKINGAIVWTVEILLFCRGNLG